jgi:hypothetical protein
MQRTFSVFVVVILDSFHHMTTIPEENLDRKTTEAQKGRARKVAQSPDIGKIVERISKRSNEGGENRPTSAP